MFSRFVEVTFKPVLVIGGLGTALAALNAFWPKYTVENVQNLEFVEKDTIFVQHWGMMVFLMGIFMIAAAFKESWRMAILLYSTIEKAFMVFLVLSNSDKPFSKGFRPPAIMDTIIVLYTLLYFGSLRRSNKH